MRPGARWNAVTAREHITLTTTPTFARRVIEELRREASWVRADGVVGVNLAYSEMSGQGKSMLFLVASGTAVRLGPPPVT